MSNKSISPLDSASPTPIQTSSDTGDTTDSNSMGLPRRRSMRLLRKRKFAGMDTYESHTNLNLPRTKALKRDTIERDQEFVKTDVAIDIIDDCGCDGKHTRPAAKRKSRNYHTHTSSLALNVHTTQSTQKSNLTRKVRFTLNKKEILSDTVTFSVISNLLSHERVTRGRTLEHFEIAGTSRLSLRNPYLCEYEFFHGFRIGICMTLGAQSDVKCAIKILSQDLVSQRAKASMMTTKHTFLCYIKTREKIMIAASIIHVDHPLKRVNIDMFAVDQLWRGNGFASMMVFLIQFRMVFYVRYDLFVCAATSAIPFWTNTKYAFHMAHKGILQQHELLDEKSGDTRHLIWNGDPMLMKSALLRCFVQSET